MEKITFETSFEGVFDFWTKKAQELFPKAKSSTDLTKAQHEIKEVKELLVSDEPYPEHELLEEYADVILAVICSIGRQGFTSEELVATMARKVRKNCNRKWKENEDGTYSHIKQSLDEHFIF